MADQDFKINVKTVADTTGITKTSEVLKALQKQQDEVNKKQQQGSQDTDLAARRIGTSIAAILAGYSLPRMIDDYTARLTEATKQIDAEGAKIVQLAQHWREMATAAEGPGDISKIAHSAADEIAKLGVQIKTIAGTDLSSLEKVGDTLTHFLTSSYGHEGHRPFSEQQQEQLRGLVALQTLLREQAKVAIEAAKSNEEWLQKLSSETPRAAIDQVISKITRLKNEQDNLNKKASDYAGRWGRIQTQIDGAAAVLSKVVALEEKRRKAAQDQAAKEGKDILTPEDRYRQQQRAEAQERFGRAAAAQAEARQLEYETEGRKRTPEEQARLKSLGDVIAGVAREDLQAEREALIRKQALQDTIIPENRRDNLEAILGPEGAYKYRARRQRIREIDQQLDQGRPPESGKTFDAAAEKIVTAMKEIWGYP